MGDTDLILIASNVLVELSGENQYVGEVSYQAGGEVGAYVHGDKVFTIGPDSDTLLDEEQSSWQISEEALLGPNGEMLPRLPGHLAYWFGWYAFFPDTVMYCDSAK